MTAHPIRYSQCWEDADVLLQALDVQRNDVCLSIAAAGDNTLALVSKGPAKVVAIDCNPAQLACLDLRVAAYKTLQYEEMLKLLGVNECGQSQRFVLYNRCRNQLSESACRFWDSHPELIAGGVINAGKFDKYLATFRRLILPLIHQPQTMEALFENRDQSSRIHFYTHRWNNWRWQLLFRVFFGRLVMGNIGRDKECFQHAHGSLARRLLPRARYALTVLNPSDNPYLSWIVTGRYGQALPFSLREENFEAIKRNLSCLEIHQALLTDYLDRTNYHFDKFNLSDVFEYMSVSEYHTALEELIARSNNDATLAYWNMIVPRHAPAKMASQIKRNNALSRMLHAKDKAFFYSDFVVERVAV